MADEVPSMDNVQAQASSGASEQNVADMFKSLQDLANKNEPQAIAEGEEHPLVTMMRECMESESFPSTQKDAEPGNSEGLQSLAESTGSDEGAKPNVDLEEAEEAGAELSQAAAMGL